MTKKEANYRKHSNSNSSNNKSKNDKPRQKKKGEKYLHILIIVVLIVVAALVALNEYNYRGIKKAVNIELGQTAPGPEVFAKNSTNKSKIQYVTDVSSLIFTEEGTYPVTVKVGNRELNVKFKVRDTVAPTGEARDITINTSTTLTPDQLVENIKDAGLVSVSWKKAPDFGIIGDYKITLTLKDMSGNKTKLKTTVKIRDVYDDMTIEANTEGTIPEAEDFFVKNIQSAEFIGDLSNVNTRLPGLYPVKLKADGMQYSSIVKVVDTTAPAVTVAKKVLLKGSTPDAMSFIESFDEITGSVTATFDQAPDTSKLGEGTGMITVSDSSGNKTQATISYIVAEFESISIEADQLPIKPESIIKNYEKYNEVTLINGDLSPETIGTTELIFTVDGAELTVYVTIVDTKVPQAEPNHVTSYACYPLEADVFVKNIIDGSKVTCTFQVKPDWTKVGTQNIVILLTDIAGNQTVVNSKVTLEKDSEPPVITGLMERFTYLNEAVSYLKEVRATDNFDKNVSITVDSQVNIRKTGSYKVTFTATDMAGNTTTASTTFTVIEATVTDEEIKVMADKILYGDGTTPGIINDNMTTAEKARKIFDWCYKKIKYVGDNNHSDWRLAAKKGFEKKSGDCYTFYAVSRALLEQLDNIELLEIRRYNASTNHYWLLVNIMGTGWYHFDTCNLGPWIDTVNQTGPRYLCFMEIDSNLTKYSKRYWRYKADLYPKVATTEFVDPEK